MSETLKIALSDQFTRQRGMILTAAGRFTEAQWAGRGDSRLAPARRGPMP